MWSLAAWVTSSDICWARSWSRTRCEHEVDDLGDLLDGQAAEDDRRVDPVEELRPEALLELLLDLLLHELVGRLGPGLLGVALDPEAERGVRLELLGARGSRS